MSANLSKLIERVRFCSNTGEEWIWDNKWISECEREINLLEAENKQLLAKLDEAIAWHEGDDCPHAQLEVELSRLKALDKKRLLLINAALSWRQSWPDETDEHSARDGVSDPVCNLIRACDAYKGLGKPT